MLTHTHAHTHTCIQVVGILLYMHCGRCSGIARTNTHTHSHAHTYTYTHTFIQVVEILLYMHCGWCSGRACRVTTIPNAKTRSNKVPEDNASSAIFLWRFFPVHSIVMDIATRCIDRVGGHRECARTCARTWERAGKRERRSKGKNAATDSTLANAP